MPTAPPPPGDAGSSLRLPPNLVDRLQGGDESRGSALLEVSNALHGFIGRRYSSLSTEAAEELAADVLWYLVERVLGPQADALPPIKDLAAWLVDRTWRQVRNPRASAAAHHEISLNASHSEVIRAPWSAYEDAERTLLRIDFDELTARLDPQAQRAVQCLAEGTFSYSEMARRDHPQDRLTSDGRRQAHGTLERVRRFFTAAWGA